jgi:protein-L-isoaspartate O-methyltransferase
MPAGGVLKRVLQTISTLPREKFVPAGTRRNTYANQPLAIDLIQTTSQT